MKNPWLLFFGIAIGSLMSGIDFLAIAVAIEPMAQSLGINTAELQWFFSAFAIGNASFLVTSGRLCDLYGRKTIFVTGSVLFILTSAVIATSSSAWLIIVARLVQGASCGTTTSAAIAILANIYAPAERTRWIAGLVGTTGLGMALGPLVGGFLTHLFSWRLVFLINVPLGLAGLIFTQLYMPNQAVQRPKHKKLNLLGMMLFSLALVLFTIGISQGPYWGWMDEKTWIAFAASLIIWMVFWFTEKKSSAPLIRKELFKIPHFLTANAVAACMYFTLTAWTLVFGLYLERVAGMNPQQAGMSLLPFGLATLILSTQASRLSAHFGIRRIIVWDCILGAVAFGIMSCFPVYPARWMMIAPFLLFGGCFLLTNAYTMQVAIERVPMEISGIASGKSMMVRWLTGAIGASVIATVFTAEAVSYVNVLTTQFDVSIIALLKEVIKGQRSAAELSTALPTNILSLAQETIRQAYHQGLVVSMRLLFGVSLLAVLISLRLLRHENL